MLILPHGFWPSHRAQMAVYLEEKETGQPGNTQGQASQLLAIMQALLKPPALSASGHERIVNGRAAASSSAVSRRDFVKSGSAALGGMALGNLEAPQAEPEADADRPDRPGAPAQLR